MTINVLWTQGGSTPATSERHLVSWVTRRITRVTDGLKVSQRSAGPNMSVDVSPGAAVIRQRDVTPGVKEGSWFVVSTAVENWPVTVPAAGFKRRYLLWLWVDKDDPSGWAEVVATFDQRPIADPFPTPGTLPNAALLAMFDVTAGQTAITDAQITDRRPLSPIPGYLVGTGEPTGPAAPGTLYVRLTDGSPVPDPWA